MATSSVKKFTPFLIFSAVLFLIFFSSRFFASGPFSSSVVSEFEGVSSKPTPYKGAFINVKKVKETKKSFTGKIVPSRSKSLDYTHMLLDDNGDVLVYLIAKGELLSFSEGYGDVLVTGEDDGTAEDGTKIIFVDSVSF